MVHFYYSSRFMGRSSWFLHLVTWCTLFNGSYIEFIVHGSYPIIDHVLEQLARVNLLSVQSVSTILNYYVTHTFPTMLLISLASQPLLSLFALGGAGPHDHMTSY